ncbi:hypothetical protein D910_07129 [Dendroctonus ponderosae]|uniref:Uncharacterized protein n=1 Tax=Dendroctonus ponderosae TaxID=77166 RepID=U4UBQ4_DENPD|nr:hypothetical protein D910_07129 [Dendroctonus ponderosae]
MVTYQSKKLIDRPQVANGAEALGAIPSITVRLLVSTSPWL